MAPAKCPACGRPVEHLELHRLFVRLDGQDVSNGATLACPSCSTVLGACFDPHVVKDLVMHEFNK